MTVEQMKEYENILQLRAEGINFGEKNCCKLFFGNVPFSPELQKARNEIELWKAAFTIKTGMKYSSRKFHRLEKKTGIFDILKQQEEAIKAGEKEAFKKYWKVKHSTRTIQNLFMERKADDLAKEKNRTVCSIIK